MFLNYYSLYSFRLENHKNNGYVCDNIAEFFEEIICGHEATIIIEKDDIKSMIDALEDGSFLESVGMERDLAESLYYDLKEVYEND